MITGKMNIARFIRRLKIAPALVLKEMTVLINQEGRGFVKDVVAITPPASQGVQGLSAKKQGERKIIANLASIYGGSNTATELVKEHGVRGEAKGFYKSLKEGDFTKANQILRPLSKGRGIYAFDGGELHRRLGGHGGRSKADPIFFTHEDDRLKAYIKKKLGMVGFLAAGYNAAAIRLGVALPEWIARHGAAFGGVEMRSDDRSFVIVIRNSVPYARKADLQRRADFVQKVRNGKLMRRLPYVLKHALKKSGLHTT